MRTEEGIVAQADIDVKCSDAVRLVRAVRSLPILNVSAAKYDYAQMQADKGKQHVVRQNPEPLCDIERREKCGETGCQVKIRKRVIKEFWEPDPA